MLSESEISTALKMSRTPVHEALLKLEFEGHLTLYPRRGALVLPVSMKDVNDVLQVRRLVELFAAEQACDSPRLGGELVAMAEHHATLLEGQDEAFVQADRDFHQRIVAATGNALLVQAYGIARDVPLRVPTTALHDDAGRADSIIVEHQLIARAIANQDRVAAREAVETHLENSRQSLLRRMR